MQLEELEVIPYSLPFREPYVTARGELTERRLIPDPRKYFKELATEPALFGF